MIISFAGHSFIPSKDKIKEIVKEQIRSNFFTGEGVVCYVGGYGDFDNACAAGCRELKKEYEKIEIVYVTPYLNNSAQDIIKEMQRLGLCDTSIYPPIETVPMRYAISKRNEWMMANADVVITYVNREYGGAYHSLLIAKRKKKRIINICDLI